MICIMNAACACSVCKEPGHSPLKCPELREMLNEGFYKPSSSYHDEDDCEESLRSEINILQAILSHTFLQE